MNEKVILVKAKGDEKWSIRQLGSLSINQIQAMQQLFLVCLDSEYVELKPCCCIVERMIPLKDIEKYGLTREDILEDMIIG